MMERLQHDQYDRRNKLRTDQFLNIDFSEIIFLIRIIHEVHAKLK